MLLAVTLIPSLQGFGPVLTRYFTTSKTAWLTIDDGPDPGTTPQVLALLEKYDALATFFLIGAKAGKHPDLTRMILDAGHTIGNHTQTHPRFSFWRFSPGALVREIDEFEATISAIGVAAPIWFRAPAGLRTRSSIRFWPPVDYNWSAGVPELLTPRSTTPTESLSASNDQLFPEPSSCFTKVTNQRFA